MSNGMVTFEMSYRGKCLTQCLTGEKLYWRKVSGMSGILGAFLERSTVKSFVVMNILEKEESVLHSS